MVKESIARGIDLSSVPTGMACRLIDCHEATLRNMAKRGEIEASKTATGRLRFNVGKYLAHQRGRSA